MIVKQGLADLESLAFLFKKSYAFKDVSTMKRGLEYFINEFLLITLSGLVPLKFVICERSLFAKDSPDVWFDRTRDVQHQQEEEKEENKKKTNTNTNKNKNKNDNTTHNNKT